MQKPQGVILKWSHKLTNKAHLITQNEKKKLDYYIQHPKEVPHFHRGFKWRSGTRSTKSSVYFPTFINVAHGKNCTSFFRK